MLFPGAAACIDGSRRVPAGHRVRRAPPRDRSRPRSAPGSQHFRFIVASGDTPSSKPAPDPYSGGRGAARRRAVRVRGDRGLALGHRVGQAAGLTCVGITTTLPRTPSSGAPTGSSTARRVHARADPGSLIPPYNPSGTIRPESAGADLAGGRRTRARAERRRGNDLASAALAIARIEYPSLEPAPYLERLGEMGQARRERGASGRSRLDRDRRVQRVPLRRGASPGTGAATTIRATAFSTKCSIGAPASRSRSRSSTWRSRAAPACGSTASTSRTLPAACQRRRRQATGPIPDHRSVPRRRAAVRVDCRQLLHQPRRRRGRVRPLAARPATRHEIIVRMLVNLKRLYVRMRSFPQARFVSSCCSRRSVASTSCAIAGCSPITSRTSPPRCATSRRTCGCLPGSRVGGAGVHDQ